MTAPAHRLGSLQVTLTDSVGAPITGPDGVVIAAISLSMPKMRLGNEAMRDQVIAAVREAAAQTAKFLKRS